MFALMFSSTFQALVKEAHAAAPCALVSDTKAAAKWVHVGPAGYANLGDKLAIASAGAAQAAVNTNGTAWLVATANGGVWQTADVTALPEPSWTQVLSDSSACTSISAMGSLGSVVVAGCGAATSSEMGNTWGIANAGDMAGVLLSTDSGETWGMTSFPPNHYVSAVVVASHSDFWIGVRSSLYDPKYGGVWRTVDGGRSFLQVFSRPVFDLRLSSSSPSGLPFLIAALPWTDDDASSIYICRSPVDAPTVWGAMGAGVDWGGRKAFYPTLALGSDVAFLGALTVNPKNASDTSSAVFASPLSALSGAAGGKGGSDGGGDGGASDGGGDGDSAAVGGGWSAVKNAPRLDIDAMPKDRMALLVHPTNDSMLFVAGNADALTWRVDVSLQGLQPLSTACPP